MPAPVIIGFNERMQVVTSSAQVEPKAGLVLVDASQEHVELTLPNPNSFRINTLAIVAKDTTLGISLVLPEGATWLDDSNVALNHKGDSLVLISDRESQWICLSRHTAHLNY